MANIILSEEEYNELKKSRDSWRECYYEVRYALRKDEILDDSLSSTDIPSDVEVIEDLKKRAADSDYYKEKSELLEEKFKEANELAESWKRDYEFIRDKLVHPIYDILYPGNLSRDINVTDFLSKIKDLKVYSDENGRMYKEIQEWREKCIARGKDIDHLLSLNKKLDKKIGELEPLITYWSNKATSRCEEECKKKYRDEISKLQNIVTEKEFEIKGLKTEIINLTFDRATVKAIMEKNIKFKETISDQEVTIKALLITIKEMCKEDETNE